jgi:hypothetical protein
MTQTEVCLSSHHQRANADGFVVTLVALIATGQSTPVGVPGSLLLKVLIDKEGLALMEYRYALRQDQGRLCDRVSPLPFGEVGIRAATLAFSSGAA